MKNKLCRRNLVISIILVLFTYLSAQSGEVIKKKNSQKNKIKTVLILGNSITKHPPKPEIGWTGNWGMAATAKDSDYVHLLIRAIHKKDNTVIIKYASIADFERTFVTYQLSNLDSLKNPDMLILKISENVNDAVAVKDNFIGYYDILVKYLTPDKNSVKVLVDGFWVKENVNRSIKEYAFKNNYPFVTITDLSKDSTNTAKGKFAHTGVAAHPSDKGMRMIEEVIWEAIKDDFTK